VSEPDHRRPDAGEADIDAASENVFADWPMQPEGPGGSVAPRTDEAEHGQEPGPDARGAAPASSIGVDLAEPEQKLQSEAPALSTASTAHLPGGLVVPDGYGVIEGTPDGRRRAVGVVVARFNADVTGQLLEGALAELDRLGVERDVITVMPVPGAFELPIGAMALAKTRRFACIVALGCVIRGETAHFDYVAAEAASGLQLAGLETGVPVAFGVLTLEHEDQAAARIEKGAEAVRTALEMADAFAQLRNAAAQ
jgi:6,7-dimethyl-8-ribityllumazine synthase